MSLESFLESASVIVLSEIGDKTFFLAVILAMRNPKWVIFAGAMAANVLMILVSVALGRLVRLIPDFVVPYLSAGLFFVFGARMMREAWKMDPDEAMEEYEEAEEEIETNKKTQKFGNGPFGKLINNAFLEIFALTLFGEWGDRSQLATVLLSARQDTAAILIGGIFGHILSTGGAVLCGDVIGRWISLRIVTVLGGMLFLAFGASALVDAWS